MEGDCKKIIGAWRYVSAVEQCADGTTKPQPRYGENGVGYIIYSAENKMCVMIMDGTRPKWASRKEPTEAELRSTVGGLMAYAGTYEVKEEEGFVVHHIEVDLVPHRVGSAPKRYYTFEENRLILRPAEPPPKDVVDYRITWERVGERAG